MSTDAESFDDEVQPGEARSGYLLDYLTGKEVQAKPEEVEAVQVFLRRLVEDYGYSKDQIQAHPQHRVRANPSGSGQDYPVDIAVFRTPEKRAEDLLILVECKKKTRNDGIHQLQIYLNMSAAPLGVWFNGDEHVYLRKILQPDGTTNFQEMPNIPRNGQRIEDIGQFRRSELRKPSNLKAVFRDIRNHLAGNTTGITRDESLAQEIINLLFCKIYDELNTPPNEIVSFRTGVDEPVEDVRQRAIDLFAKVKTEYSDVFSADDAINLDAPSIVYVIGELQNYCITESDRDAVGEAFEVFIGPALRGGEGQFFTPRNVVKMVLDLVDPSPGEMIIDPACGSGGFLITALEHIWKKIDLEADLKGWNDVQRDRRKRDIASRCFRGIDKDAFLAKVTKAYMAIMGDGRGGIFCDNSLLPPGDWDAGTRAAIGLGTFDVVVTNPPFGAKIKIRGGSLLAQYDLAHKWIHDKATDTYSRDSSIYTDRPPQMLFLERCLQLLKPGGRLGVVLPESLLGNPSYKHVIDYLLTRTTINAVVTLPEALFKTSGKGGTHTKVCVLVLTKNQPATAYDLFMSQVNWCGHDSRGNPTYRKAPDGALKLLDEVPEVAPRYSALTASSTSSPDHLGFLLSSDSVHNRILVPKYYSPEIAARLGELQTTHTFMTLGDLVAVEAVSISTGVEVSKMAYGTGSIPFVRTSDLANWEIKTDFKHGVSEAVYDSHKSRGSVKAGDILMVRDGTYLIGAAAMVTDDDLPMLFQSHIYRIRVLKPEVIDPWLLLTALNSTIVKAQVRSKQFTQDIIDTLGNRALELYLPIPNDPVLREQLAERAKQVVEGRQRLRKEAATITRAIENLDLGGPASFTGDLVEQTVDSQD